MRLEDQHNLSSKNLHDTFLKQAKYKLKKSHSKDFKDLLENYKEVF